MSDRAGANGPRTTKRRAESSRSRSSVRPRGTAAEVDSVVAEPADLGLLRKQDRRRFVDPFLEFLASHTVFPGPGVELAP